MPPEVESPPTEQEAFFKHPILNSPYECPSRHWELDGTNQPTHKILNHRRKVSFVTPIARPKLRKGKKSKTSQGQQHELDLDETGLSSKDQQYDLIGNINEIRRKVDLWRNIPNPDHWQVTPETARLLQHWRSYDFTGLRPFFCQVEAVEVAIWMTEVAPKTGKDGRVYINTLHAANEDANPGLNRIALKLATGAGKTTVMAMLIAWQTINAVRRPSSKKYTKGFLIVAPGITIRDRLRVLLPNDPDSYYKNRELVPNDLLPDLGKAEIVITNYHAFKLRETMDLSKGNRRLLQGRGDAITSTETEGQMIQRVMPKLMSMRNILVLNDEAHHCYQQKPGESQEDKRTGDERKEAEENSKAASLWISGLRMVQEKLGINRIFDLSATPFFLSGSGYAEGTLFPWTMSDFSLMDAIECGIVKLPRVPVADNLPGATDDDMPMFRKLWDHIGKKMPKKGRGKSDSTDPHALPTELLSALEALYGHYAETFRLWQEEGLRSPPCFIVVCNNTASSELVYKYISGFWSTNEDESESFNEGRLKLFQNHDEHDNPLPRPRTLLIDSAQLESGDALDKNFRAAAKDEIDRFRRDIIERTGDQQKAAQITDQDLLREVMNTVGKPGQLGGDIRCVVSVSMLTEGWDANTVTHVLGVRAFGTQLLCEQVVGRALRRQSYEVNEDTNLFDPEYANILGIPFDFTANPTASPPQRPRETVHVHAVRPERDDLEITFPNVDGYRVEMPEHNVAARFTADSTLCLTPHLIGPSVTRTEGIVGEGIDLTLEFTRDTRPSEVVYKLTAWLWEHHWRDANDERRMNLFGQLKRVTRQWLDKHLDCQGGTFPAQVLFPQIADMAAEKITAGIVLENVGTRPVTAIVDAYNPIGSTQHVSFNSSKTDRWETSPDKCHVNWAILDSTWEGEFCRIAEGHAKVRAYVKNHGLHFRVPYLMAGELKTYIPDYIVRVDDGRGEDDLLNLVVEIKGYRGEDAKIKKQTMDTYWVPGVNYLGRYGRWAFAEFCDIYTMEAEFEAKLEEHFNTMISSALKADTKSETQD